MKAVKLKSGSWRCQVYDHSEMVLQDDGTYKRKQIYKSFTSKDPTLKGKKECELEAARWAAERPDDSEPSSETVKEAIERYCDERCAIMSPSTLKSYNSILRSHMGTLGSIKLIDLSEHDVQSWVNELTNSYNPRLKNKVKISPKTVKNIYGLLSTVLRDNGIIFKIRLPQQVRPDLYVPSDSDISRLIEYFTEHDKDMLIAVYLAAFGSLRRSEVCALTADDVFGNVIHVRNAVVSDINGMIVKKTTKTYSSQRDIVMPDFIIDILPKRGRLVPLSPQTVSHRFTRSLEKLSLPNFRFHDLRHYTASIMHALGIPDVYIMERGGWSNDGTLKRIYRNSMSEYEQKFNAVLMRHFDEIQKNSSHDSSHELGSDLANPHKYSVSGELDMGLESDKDDSEKC